MNIYPQVAQILFWHKEIINIESNDRNRIQEICWLSDVDYAVEQYKKQNKKTSPELIGMTGLGKYVLTDSVPITPQITSPEITHTLSIFNSLTKANVDPIDTSDYELQKEIISFWNDHIDSRNSENSKMNKFDMNNKYDYTYSWIKNIAEGEVIPLHYGFLISNPIKDSKVYELINES